jgi:hypothetical protein
MNNKTTTSSSGGMGILSWLQVIFIVLKVLNLIDWSWFKVFIPTWIGLGLFVILIILLAISEMHN